MVSQNSILHQSVTNDKMELFSEALAIEPRNWTKLHIQVLPKQYLLNNISTFTLTKIWDDLPDSLKNDEEIQSHLPCLEHYNRDEDTIHIDGPPPSKFRCRGCKREQQLKNDKKREIERTTGDGDFGNSKKIMIFSTG